MNLNGLIILITGASKGIGKTLANTLNNKGATVIGIYNQTKIEEVYDTYKCDISNEQEVQELMQN